MAERNPHRKRKIWERALEVVPAVLTWGTFIAAIGLSFTHPAWAAAYIIIFDTYWVLKAINTSFHLISSYNHYRHDLQLDWLSVLEFMKERDKYLAWLSAREKKVKFWWKGILRYEKQKFIKKTHIIEWKEIYHAVLFPFVDESAEVLQTSIQGVLASSYPKEKIIIVLAREERVGEEARLIAENLKEEYQGKVGGFLISAHPEGLEGEIRGKSANASYAAQYTLIPWLKQKNINLNNVIISNLDCDTIVYHQYLARVTYEWLLADNPHRNSYQPITLYNNNMWDSPAFVRVVAVANSFWQFMESSRPDRLRTFSSHSMSLITLQEVGFWKKDIVNEDGFIFWQCYMHFDGNYQVLPLFTPVLMDTCLADTYKQTLVNQYKQKRRWAYNVEYWPHLVPKLLSNGKISLYNRVYKLWQYIEGNYNWATASIIIATLGFLPSFLGDNFNGTVLGFNLPYATRLMMNIALVFLIASVYINMILLPPRPIKYKWTRTAAMYIQWALVPIISIIWGSVPAIDAQTRLAMGKYMEFWVTPKSRPMSTVVREHVSVSQVQEQISKT